MKKITLETPFGQEILCQSTLDAVILHLSEALCPITASYAASPTVARLVKQMLPTVREEWRSQTTDGTAYLEVTPDVLMGFGFSLSLYDLPDLPPPASLPACWGLALAVAEGLRAGMEAPDGVAVCSLFVENALQLAAGNTRVTVGLRVVGSNEKSPRQHAENP